MSKYVGPKTTGTNLATQDDINSMVANSGAAIEVSSTPPNSASSGDLWFDSDVARLYIYYDNSWVNPASLGAGISASSAQTITGVNAEGTSNNLARADHDHAIDASLLVPTGSVISYAGTTSPTGWLLCDGSEKAVATYPNLNSVLGTTYGSRTNGSGGAGSSHFRLPDLRGRVTAGKDDMGGVAASRLTNTVLSENNTLGATGGSQTHTLTEAQMPSHSHSSVGGSGVFWEQRNGYGSVTASDPGPNNAARANISGISNTGGGGSHTNTQPTIVMNYIIKT